jgi:hypothetical protein
MLGEGFGGEGAVATITPAQAITRGPASSRAAPWGTDSLTAMQLAGGRSRREILELANPTQQRLAVDLPHCGEFLRRS